MNNYILKKYVFIYGLVLILSTASIVSQSEVTTSRFTDEASITSSLATGVIDIDFSGQDYTYYLSTNKISYAALETSAEQLWVPERSPVVKIMEISNKGNIDFFYALNKDFGAGLVDSSAAYNVQVFIDNNLTYVGKVSELSTEKHRLNVSQTSEIKFILTMPSTHQDDIYSGMRTSAKINVDFFLANSTQTPTTIYWSRPFIYIDADNATWREDFRSVSNRSNTSVMLELVRVKGINESTIEYSTHEDFSDSTSFRTEYLFDSMWGSFVINDLKPGTTYYVRSRIENPPAGSGVSDPYSFTTLP